MKILHILHRSLPGDHGYAIRSKYIVEYQKQLSLDPIVITSPFQSGSDHGNGNPEIINGIPYYRTNFSGKIGSAQVRSSSIWSSAFRLPLMFLFANQVLNVAKEIRPSIIHAHSPFYCGLIASFVSRILNIPCVYEIRGVWEGSSDSAKSFIASLPRNIIRFLESIAVNNAGAVVVISEALKNELSARGINKKTYIVPNGVDTSKFTYREKSRQLIEKLKLYGQVVLGYIGTFSAEYEGLEYLVRAMPLIIKEYPNVLLLMVGDGRLKNNLEEICKEMGVMEYVNFVGRIPHDKVSEYYDLIDISVFPRKRTRVTELVTALKPLEAMVNGKAAIGSDVGGMHELISDEETGLLFEAENINDLAYKCLDLIKDEKKRDTLGRLSKEWVVENRDWSKIVPRYLKIYEDLRRMKSTE